MYAGAAEVRNFRPMEGELRRWFPSDLGGDAPPLFNPFYSASLSEYDVVGDLFNAPEPIIEEPIFELDPITAAICMMSSGEDVIAAEAMIVADIEFIQSEHLFSEVFYDCKKDLLEKSAIQESFPEPPDFKLPAVLIEGDSTVEKDSSSTGQLQKSVSFGCLKSTEWTMDSRMNSNLDGLQELNLEDAYGIRRAYSEGDIHILKNCGSSLRDQITVHSSFEQLEIRDLKIEEKIMEERKEKINRYMRKKTRRNFGRKIKYLCRKTLADSQPRVRGRFAKSEACEAAAAKLQHI
ncbi:hypothetical protein M5K25_026166 [Dendrobium thyrsiflorum]|uniref:CCT domain-containing protein n=1 Tax=Dendrobium thyrsiflorum TaxID=117978 RepID=A0ABD0TWR6_DENTH